MGLLMGALAGAGAAVERTTGDAMRAMMDEEKAKRIAEYTTTMKHGLDKADAEEERTRVKGILSGPVKIDQGDGMLAPASGDPAELAQTTREPTNAEMVGRALKAGDLKIAADVGKLDDKDAANAIKLQIAQGRFENALAIAQMKGDFGMMLGELKAASANGSGKATEMMRNWEFLKDQGWPSDKIAQKLLDGKVGEFTTVATEGTDEKGQKVVTTRKMRPGDDRMDTGQGGSKYPTPGSVNTQKLLGNPDKAAEFDSVFGPGAANKILQGSSTLDPSRFSKSAPAATKVNPLTGERMTKGQFEAKFGRGSFDGA